MAGLTGSVPRRWRALGPQATRRLRSATRQQSHHPPGWRRRRWWARFAAARDGRLCRSRLRDQPRPWWAPRRLERCGSARPFPGSQSPPGAVPASHATHHRFARGQCRSGEVVLAATPHQLAGPWRGDPGPGLSGGRPWGRNSAVVPPRAASMDLLMPCAESDILRTCRLRQGVGRQEGAAP
jgi:hypothetical protein